MSEVREWRVRQTTDNRESLDWTPGEFVERTVNRARKLLGK